MALVSEVHAHGPVQNQNVKICLFQLEFHLLWVPFANLNQRSCSRYTCHQQHKTLNTGLEFKIIDPVHFTKKLTSESQF